ncbi:hypothetical protein PR002_g11156 [Phytophthora rubi]|uniref:Uncharacterized protein n=1 Tax=Phytophthora rubi TaxID=129364 RepID=A0A6A3MAU1_9STRA|nr:hypothetical protein PR002_g11156 [Phytophthora rubi]
MSLITSASARKAFCTHIASTAGSVSICSTAAVNLCVCGGVDGLLGVVRGPAGGVVAVVPASGDIVDSFTAGVGVAGLPTGVCVTGLPAGGVVTMPSSSPVVLVAAATLVALMAAAGVVTEGA